MARGCWSEASPTAPAAAFLLSPLCLFICQMGRLVIKELLAPSAITPRAIFPGTYSSVPHSFTDLPTLLCGNPLVHLLIQPPSPSLLPSLLLFHKHLLSTCYKLPDLPILPRLAVTVPFPMEGPSLWGVMGVGCGNAGDALTTHLSSCLCQVLL